MRPPQNLAAHIWYRRRKPSRCGSVVGKFDVLKMLCVCGLGPPIGDTIVSRYHQWFRCDATGYEYDVK
jgi:hypothetical protein